MKSFALCVVLLVVSLAPALSAYDAPRNQSMTYEVQMAPRVRTTSPWTGVLVITINDESIVSGTYRSNSIRPDPFRGQRIIVTGGLNGDNIRVSFGTTGNITVRGTISNDGIVGSFTHNNAPWDFNAVRVTGS